MNKPGLAKIVGLLACLSGALVMLGWIAGIDALKSIAPGWVTMKFTTAIAFFFSGIVLFVVARCRSGKKCSLSKIILPAACFTLLLLMATLLISSLIGVRTGLEDLVVKEQANAVKTTTPGRPSTATMAAFVLIAIAGVTTLFETKNEAKYLTALGAAVMIIGLIALGGYALNAPLLYYSIEGVSTAMAIHTAALFALLGAGFVLTGKTEEGDAERE